MYALFSHECTGSIPACAGEPLLKLAVVGESRVYPRVCGGTLMIRFGTTSPPGLSPRVRGNPLLDPDSLRAPRVYPRVCGGTAMEIDRPRFSWGLSPRVRGNLSIGCYYAAGSRSIPACAGEPGERRRSISSARVYPRVCGGTNVTNQHGVQIRGLSPRVRGNHSQATHQCT